MDNERDFFRRLKRVIKFIFPMKYRNDKMIIWISLANFFKRKKFNNLSLFCQNKVYYRYHCDISSSAILSGDIKIPHPLGIVVGEGVYIGKNVTIYQNVTIGRKIKDVSEYPKICDNVTIYSNSIILGNITVAEGTVIGANSMLVNDTIPNGVYVGSPAKKIN